MDLYRQDTKDERSVNHHGLALYVAGVAVECMLRAFLTRRTREFDSRHDLKGLLLESGILDLDAASVPLARLSEEELASIKKELGSAVSRVYRVWRNGFRYAPETRLRSHLHEMDLDRGIKGDVLKENLRRVLEASNIIVMRGSVLWEASSKPPKK